jgi:hypothetical protein
MMHWDAPPPMKQWMPSPAGEAMNLTGVKFGRFTVVGLLDLDGGKNRGERWVCRCVCGDYESRSPKSIKLATLAASGTLSNQCFYCFQWAVTKTRYKKKGAKPLQTFIDGKPKKEKQLNRPETIIAEKVSKLISTNDGGYQIGVDVVSALNKAGFRIVRDKINGLDPVSPANKTGDSA